MPSVAIEMYASAMCGEGMYITMQGQRIAQGADVVSHVQSVFVSVIYELLFAMLRWRLYGDQSYRGVALHI